MLAMESGNIFNCKNFEQSEIKFKQRSFDDDLLLIWMNNFRHCFCFCNTSYLVLPIMLTILQGECNCDKSCVGLVRTSVNRRPIRMAVFWVLR